eukprot:gene14615-4319_t
MCRRLPFIVILGVCAVGYVVLEMASMSHLSRTTAINSRGTAMLGNKSNRTLWASSSSWVSAYFQSGVLAQTWWKKGDSSDHVLVREGLDRTPDNFTSDDAQDQRPVSCDEQMGCGDCVAMEQCGWCASASKCIDLLVKSRCMDLE